MLGVVEIVLPDNPCRESSTTLEGALRNDLHTVTPTGLNVESRGHSALKESWTALKLGASISNAFNLEVEISDETHSHLTMVHGHLVK